MGSRLLSFSPPNPNHHDLVFNHGRSMSMMIAITCLPHSISSLHGWELKQCRLPSSESFLSRNPNAASIGLYLRRLLSSSSVLHPQGPYGGTEKTNTMVQLKKAGAEGRQVVKVVLNRMFATSVLNLEIGSGQRVDSRTTAAADEEKPKAAKGWMPMSAAAMAGKRDWLSWTWASHSQIWASAMWAVEALFGLGALKIDYGPCLLGVMSIGYLYPFSS